MLLMLYWIPVHLNCAAEIVSDTSAFKLVTDNLDMRNKCWHGSSSSSSAEETRINGGLIEK
jgi:hypothetical protein